VIPDKYATVGSGAEIAVGVLEAGYRDNLSIEEGKELAIRAMKAALARDATSGNGIDLMIISKDGLKEESLPA
ncbi:MAG: proteasome subunit beta, partial [Candidatus Bathyarchaeia archaeon]